MKVRLVFSLCKLVVGAQFSELLTFYTEPGSSKEG